MLLLSTGWVRVFFGLFFTAILSACGGGGGGGGDSSPPVAAPTISEHPQNVSADIGSSASFAVAVSNTSSVTYQWLRSGQEIAGANGSSYTIAEASSSDNGAEFSVKVTNPGGSVTSSSAFLWVYAGAPVVTQPPKDQSVNAGSAATLSVIAHGAPPLSFQWRKYGIEIPGATSASYLTPTLTPSDSGAYFDVVVTNSLGSTNSTAATVTVTAAAGQISFGSHPQSLSLNEGDIAAFSVVADGIGPFKYQWYRNGTAIPGAYESVLRFTATQLHHGDQYSVVASNTVGTATSATASLSVARGAISLLMGTLGGHGNTDGVVDEARFSCPLGIVGDASGNLYVASRYNGAIRKISPEQTVSSFVGNPYFEGSNDGIGSNALFRSPSGLAKDNAGNLYVTDGGNNTVRKVTPTGIVTTIAGLAGNVGSADGIGTSARFNLDEGLGKCNLNGIAVDSANTIYIADTFNHTIRKISSAGEVTTFAGNAGNPGLADGQGTTARFNQPRGLAIDSEGNIFVADSLNGKVRKIDQAGNVSTLEKSFTARNIGPGLEGIEGIAVDSQGLIYLTEAPHYIWRSDTTGAFYRIAGGGFTGGIDGIGAESSFHNPKAVFIDPLGNAFVSDEVSIRKIRPDHRVSTFAGKDNYQLSRAQNNEATTDPFLLGFNTAGFAVDSLRNIYVAYSRAILKVAPTGARSVFAGSIPDQGTNDGIGSAARFISVGNLKMDSSDNLYVTDVGAHTVRKITPSGAVTTIAGLAEQSGANDGQGSAARFNTPLGLAIDMTGNIYVADRGNYTIRKISPTGVVTTLAGAAGVSGTANGTGPSASFENPVRLAVDSTGNVFVAQPNALRPVRKITSGGVVTSIGSWGVVSVDGNSTTAAFESADGITSDTNGNVYVNDSRLLRKIAPNGDVTTVAGLGNSYGVLLGSIPGSLGFSHDIVNVPITSGLQFIMVSEQSLLQLTLP